MRNWLSKNGITLLVVAQLIIIGLKMGSVITFSWWLVCLPVILVSTIIIGFFAWIGYSLIAGKKPNY